MKQHLAVGMAPTSQVSDESTGNVIAEMRASPVLLGSLSDRYGDSPRDSFLL